MTLLPLIIVALSLTFSATTVEALVLCARPQKDGTFNSRVNVRETCIAGESELDPEILGLQGPRGERGEEGPPGPAGENGTDGLDGAPGAFVLYDGNGSEMGRLVGSSRTNYPLAGDFEYDVWIESLGAILRIYWGTRFRFDQNTIHFAEGSCDAQAYVATKDGDANTVVVTWESDASHNVISARFFVPTEPYTGPATPRLAQLFGNRCNSAGNPLIYPNSYWLATEVELPFEVPIVGPLRVVQSP